VGKESRRGVGGGEATSDYSAVTISFFGMSQWKGNFPEEVHMRTQGE